ERPRARGGARRAAPLLARRPRRPPRAPVPREPPRAGAARRAGRGDGDALDRARPPRPALTVAVRLVRAMGPGEIPALRGGLTRAAFAKLVGVTPLTVLRWELPEDNKESRRPRAKMIEALKALAAEGVPAPQKTEAPDAEEDEALVLPLLDALWHEGWPRAEDQLIALLSSSRVTSVGARTLAVLGIAQAQLVGRFDVRSSLTSLFPILADAEDGRLAPHVAARAHLLGAFFFGAPDPRVHNPGRVNAHAARAEALLEPDDDDPRIQLAMARMAASTMGGPSVVTRTYEAIAPALARAKSPLARLFAEEMHQIAARFRGHAAVADAHGDAAIALAEQLG